MFCDRRHSSGPMGDAGSNWRVWFCPFGMNRGGWTEKLRSTQSFVRRPAAVFGPATHASRLPAMAKACLKHAALIALGRLALAEDILGLRVVGILLLMYRDRSS